MEEKHMDGSFLPRGLCCLLTYLIPYLGGVLFLLVEKEDRLVRFHAVQSILFWIFFTFYGAVAGSLVGSQLFRSALHAAFFLLWVFMMYQAFCERMYDLPILGDISRKLAFRAPRE